jgi:hypothetical protein
MRPIQALLILAMAALAGCSGRVAPSAKLKKPQTAREWLARYGKLQFSRTSENPFLRDELARIEAENGLPEQFMKVDSDLNAKSANHPLIAIASAEQLNYLDRRLAFVYPQADFAVAERHITEIERLCREYKSLRENLGRFSKSNDWTVDLAFDEGSLFGGRFIPCIETAIKLELTAGGLGVKTEDFRTARNCFERAWRSVEILASQPHLESRVLAAQMRVAALRLLEAMLQSPHCSVEEVRSLRDLLAATIENWPGDDRLWRGERARALHFFEMMRDGQALSLADEELQAAIDDHGGSKDFGVWLHAHIDADEVYYLDQMRKLIDSCDAPFAERNPTIAELFSDLQRRARTDDDPLLSRLMLFDDVESAMRWQASDRLHCEVMLIALDESLGERTASKDLRISPLTGRDYRVSVLQRIIRVDGDSEIGELGYAVSTPRYDLAVAVAPNDGDSREEEAELSERPKRRQKSAERLP